VVTGRTFNPIFNPKIDLDVLKSTSVRHALCSAKMLKIGHLLNEDGWISAETLATKLGIKSVRVVQRLLNYLYECMPVDCRDSLFLHKKRKCSFFFPRTGYYSCDWIVARKLRWHFILQDTSTGEFHRNWENSYSHAVCKQPILTPKASLN